MILLLLFLYFLRYGSGHPLSPYPWVPNEDRSSFTAVCKNLRHDVRDILASPAQADCNERQVLDILWSCLSTIFACTWVSIHPNIKPPTHDKWNGTLTRIHIMNLGVLLPELIFLWAMRQWVGAQYLANFSELKEHGFTIMHAYLFQMGGFMIFKGEARLGVVCDPETQLLPLLKGERFKYAGHTILPEDVRFKLPTKEDMQDNSKGDELSKALVVGQTTWFVVQCISRWALGLDVTELELVTLAFAVLNAGNYYLWWNKPLSIHYAFPILWTPPPSSTEGIPEEGPSVDKQEPDLSRTIKTNLKLIPRIKRVSRKIIGEVIVILTEARKTPLEVLKTQLNNLRRYHLQRPADGEMNVSLFYAYAPPTVVETLPITVVGIVSSGFGAIHCVAWRFFFPSEPERIIWRIAALAITILPGALSIVWAIDSRWGNTASRFGNFLESRERWPTYIFWIILLELPAYIGVRTALLAVALLALRDLQPGQRAQIGWENFLPHI